MSNKILTETDYNGRIANLANRIVNPPDPAKDKERNKKLQDIALGVLGKHHNISKISVVAANVILQSNPALDRSLDILSGLIANPDGGDGTDLLVDVAIPDGSGIKVSKGEVTEVVDFVGKYLNDTLNLRSKLEGIVKEILGIRGAYVELYIPDGVTESLIKTLGTESRSKSEFKAIIDSQAKHKQQDVWSNTLIDITSDVNRYLPRLVSQEQFTRLGNEADSRRKVSLSKVMRTRRFNKEVPMVTFDSTCVNAGRLSTMTKIAPAECVHPVCAVGDPETILGHIFLLDEHNGFARVDEDMDFESELRKADNDKDTGDSALGRISKAFDLGKAKETGADALYAAFSENLESKMIKSLMEGNYVENYSLADDQQLSEIMFWRMLRNRKTRALFVPESLVTYIAFYRNKSGVGQSILNRGKLLSRLYTVLYYANFLSYLEDAIPRVKLNATMDEADTDQKQTRARIATEYMQNRTNVLASSDSNPAGIIDALVRNSVQVNVQGAGPDSNISTMEINEERVKRDTVKVDTNYLSEIRRDLVQSINVPQQWVDDSWTPNFKAEIVRDNELVNRQIGRYTNTLNDGITEMAVKRILNDPILTEALLVKFKGSRDERLQKLELSLIFMSVKLPKPKVNGVEFNKEQLDTHRQIVRDIVMDQLPDTLVDQIEEMDAAMLEGFRGGLTTWLMRQFTQRSTQFGEIAEIFSDPKRLAEIVKVESVTAGALVTEAAKFAATVTKSDVKGASKVEKARSAAEDPLGGDDPETGTGSEPEPSDGDNPGDDGGDGLGGDEFQF